MRFLFLLGVLHDRSERGDIFTVSLRLRLIITHRFLVLDSSCYRRWFDKRPGQNTEADIVRNKIVVLTYIVTSDELFSVWAYRRRYLRQPVLTIYLSWNRPEFEMGDLELRGHVNVAVCPPVTRLIHYHSNTTGQLPPSTRD